MSRYQFPAQATTDASLLVSGTLADARLSSNVALENTANVFTAKQSFSGTTHSGLCLHSLTTSEYNALTPANGDLFRDSTTDRIDARLARGTVELVDTAGGQTINGALTATGNVTGSSFVASGTLSAFGANCFVAGTIATASTGMIGFSNSTNPGSTQDARFSRVSSGVIQVGTTANNALGSLNLTNLTASGTITASGTGAHTFGTTNTVTITAGAISASQGTGVPTLNIANPGNSSPDACARIGTASAGLWVAGANYGVRATAGNATTVPFTARGFAGQTANLQEWQNSAATVLASVSSAGNLTASGTVRLGTFTVGTLPSAAANTRAMAFVTDSNLAFNSTNLGSTVTAGGAILVPVFSDGINWVIG